MNDLSPNMAELREWIIEHGVDVRNLRMEAQAEGAKDTGDYLHWLERKVFELRESVEFLEEDILDTQVKVDKREKP